MVGVIIPVIMSQDLINVVVEVDTLLQVMVTVVMVSDDDDVSLQSTYPKKSPHFVSRIILNS